MHHRNSRAFTLVELIVVITILAILGTIAFISFFQYAQSARDAVRKTDIANSKTALELFQVRAGVYPDPDDAVAITYSGATVFTQGTFGYSTNAATKHLSPKPVDPLTGSEYTYSLLHNRTEYELSAAFEREIRNPLAAVLVPTAHALGDKQGIAYVVGTYNSQVTAINAGSEAVVLALPSITVNDTSDPDLVSLVSNKGLVYDSFANLPASYSGSTFDVAGGFDFTPGSLVAYAVTGSLSDLQTVFGTAAGQLDLLLGIRAAYTGSLLAPVSMNHEVLIADIDNDRPGSLTLAYNIITYRLKMTGVPATSLSNAIAGRWSWGTHLGWINFNSTYGNVILTDAALTGRAWGRQSGWITLAPTQAGVTNTCAGDLDGYAWSPVYGYIDFDGVRADANGYLHGKATLTSYGSIYFHGTSFSSKMAWTPSCAPGGSLTITSPTDSSTITDTTPTIAGAGATVGSTVHVTTPSDSGCTATVTAGGVWTCTIDPALDAGTNSIAATEIAAAGQALQSASIGVTLQ